MLVEFAYSEASLLGVQMTFFSLCPHMACSLCGRVQGISMYIQLSSSSKDTSWIQFKLNYLFDNLIYKIVSF